MVIVILGICVSAGCYTKEFRVSFVLCALCCKYSYETSLENWIEGKIAHVIKNSSCYPDKG